MFHKDLRIHYSHDKRKFSNGQLWKIWKETALIELWSYFIDILAFEPGKLCPGVEILFSFSTRGPGFCTEKLSRGGDFVGKISSPGVSPGGMVTGQIDTCIIPLTVIFHRLIILIVRSKLLPAFYFQCIKLMLQ